MSYQLVGEVLADEGYDGILAKMDLDTLELRHGPDSDGMQQ